MLEAVYSPHLLRVSPEGCNAAPIYTFIVQTPDGFRGLELMVAA
jgi:hypothetical protein